MSLQIFQKMEARQRLLRMMSQIFKHTLQGDDIASNRPRNIALLHLGYLAWNDDEIRSFDTSECRRSE